MNEQEAYNSIKERIYKGRGLDVSQYKENYLKRRIAVRMRAVNRHTYAEYDEYLGNNESEMSILLDRLTINVTQFFRDPEVFVELENSLLPGILESTGGNIKIWSAGCSSGEEPYSVAISVWEAAEKMGIEDCPFEIYATDIDEAVLRHALSGKYEGHTLDNIAHTRKTKFFSQEGKSYIIKDFIKNKVRFMKADIMKPFKEKFFDMVLCRNVIIYFTRELQSRVLGFFYDSLKKDGILFLGKTETMLSDYREKFCCINVKERIFRKVETK